MSNRQSPATGGREVPESARRLLGLLAAAGATTAMAFGFGSLALTSVFIRPLEAEFGWSRADISLAYTLSSVGMALGGLFWGRLADRLNIRTLLFIGSAGMVIALAALSFATSLWQIYAANFALGGLGFACLYAPVLAVTGLWFDRRRGLAIGIVTAGGALGQGILPYAANALIDGVGWRLAYAIIAVATTAALAIFMPAVQAPPVDRILAAPVRFSATPGFQGGHLSPVTLLSAAAFLCCVCMGVPLMHLTSFVTAVCGSSDVGSLSLLIAMLFGAIGRIAFGLLADRAGNLSAYALASFIQTACVAIFPALDQQLSLLALSAVFGFGFAGNMTCLILCVRQFAPAERFGHSLGVVMLIAWVGMGVAGYFGGFVYDSFGSYGPAFLVAFVAGAANLVVLGVLAASYGARAQVPCGRLPDPAMRR